MCFTEIVYIYFIYVPFSLLDKTIIKLDILHQDHASRSSNYETLWKHDQVSTNAEAKALALCERGKGYHKYEERPQS